MKNKILLTLKISLVIFLLWFLMHSSQLKLSLLYTFVQKPFLSLEVLFLLFITVGISAWRWWNLNHIQNIKFSFKHTFGPTYLGIGLNNLLPGSVGGDFVRLFYLFKKFPDQKSSATLSIFFDRLTGLMGIFIMVCLIALFKISLFTQDKSLFYFLLSCITICVGSLIVFFILLFYLQESLKTWLVKHFASKFWLSRVISVLDAFYLYKHAKLAILKCLMASIFIQIIIVGAIVIINHILELPPLSALDFAIAIAVTQIANLIPVTPGGLGIGEAAFANILLLLNPGIMAAYATVFLAFRMIGMISYLPGLIFYVLNFKQLENQIKSTSSTLEAG